MPPGIAYCFSALQGAAKARYTERSGLAAFLNGLLDATRYKNINKSYLTL